MAYTKKALKKLALAKAKKLKLCFHSHISGNMGICSTTYYQHELHLDDDINAIILENKSNRKTELISKMVDSDSSALIIFLYKLLASPDELAVLFPKEDKTDTTVTIEAINIEMPDDNKSKTDI